MSISRRMPWIPVRVGKIHGAQATVALAACGATIASGAAVCLAVTGPSSTRSVLDIVVLALGVTATLALMTSERLGLTLTLYAVYIGCLDGVLKLESGSQFGTLGRDGILYAIVGGWLIRVLVRHKPIRLPPGTALVLIWTAVILVQIPNPAGAGLMHSVISIRPDLEFVPLFFVGYAFMRTENRLWSFLVILLALAAVNGAISLIQLNLTPQELARWGPGYSVLELGGTGSGTSYQFGITYVAGGAAHVRPLGLGGFPGFAGVMSVLALPGGLALLSQRTPMIPRWLTALLLALSFIGVITSQTRTAVLGSVVVILAFTLLTTTPRQAFRNFGIFAAVAVIGYGAGTALVGNGPNRYSTIAPNKVLSTVTTYKSATYALIPRYLVDYPLGVGLGMTGAASKSTVGGVISQSRSYDAETEFTFLICEGGIPGLLAMAGVFVWTIRAGLRSRRQAYDPQVRVPLMALLAVALFLAADWFFGAVTAQSPTGPATWLIMGVFAFWRSPASSNAGVGA